MRVAFFLNDMCSSGGIQRVAANLARDLGPDHETRVLTVYRCANPVFAEEGVQLDSLELPYVPGKFFPSAEEMGRIGWRLRRYVARHGIDVVVCFWWHLAIVGAFSLPRSVAKIGYEHIAYAGAFGHWRTWRRLAYPRLDAIVSLTVEDSPAFLAIAQRGRLNPLGALLRGGMKADAGRERRGGGPVCAVRVIPNYVDDMPCPVPTDEREPIILVVGHVEPRKGVDRLLWALQGPLLAQPSWRLVIVGDDTRDPHHASYRQRLRDLILLLQLSDQVEFQASTPDIADWYRRASIYVMGSRLEGLPMVLLEAKAHGLPIVSFACPTGPKEIVRHEIDGFLFDDDSGAFAEAVIHLMTDESLRHRMGESAMEDVRQRFVFSQVRPLWLEILAGMRSGAKQGIDDRDAEDRMIAGARRTGERSADGKEVPITTNWTMGTPKGDSVNPFAMTAEYNFGATGHRGTLAIFDGTDPNGSAVWRKLSQFATRFINAADFAGTVLFCMGERLDLDASLSAPIEPLLAFAQAPNRALGATITANLSDYHALREIEERLEQVPEPLCLVAGELLEYLTDPRPFLRTMRRMLKRHSENRLLLGTLNREGVARAQLGSSDLLRSWSASEIRAFLESSGFDVESSELNDLVHIQVLRSSREVHAAFVKVAGLPEQSDRLLLIASDQLVSGASRIKRALEELSRCLKPKPLVLSVGFSDVLNGWLRSEAFATFKNDWLAPEAVLEAVKHLVFLYDEVRLIEYPDHGGIFFRVAQAKRAGLLPLDVVCQVTCHGSHFFLERARKTWLGPDANLTHVREKIAIELADLVCFPTNYARSLYLDHLGLKPLGETMIAGLPHGEITSQAPPPQFLDTLVFFGPRDGQTGWQTFCEALELVLPVFVGSRRGIRRLVLLGIQIDGRGIQVPDMVSVECLDGADHRAVLRELSSSALVVLPVGEGSCAYGLLDVINAGCQPLVLAGSGGEELIPPSLRALCSCQSHELVEGLRRALTLSREARKSLLCELLHATRERQRAIKTRLAKLPEQPRQAHGSPVSLLTEPSPVTVVVPVYDRPIREIEDLIVGINQQALLPREVIFVDDASTDDLAARHGERIISLLRVPARFVRHTRNRGLSGARNTGLMATETEFIAVHDSDNIAGNDLLYRGCMALRTNPQVDAVTFLADTFVDGQDWRRFDPNRDRYYPIGDGLVISLGRMNWIGDAMGVYRVSALRELGGWDERDRAMWEDLGLYLKMLGANRRLMNIPAFDILYRVRSDSMLRTAPEYDARQLLSRAVGSLSMFEALCLMRLVVADMLGEEARGHQAQQGSLNAHGHLVAAMKLYLGRMPWIYRHARTVLRTAQGIKRALLG